MKEQNKPADELLEAIKTWCQKVEGKTLSGKELLERATNVLKSRIEERNER